MQRWALLEPFNPKSSPQVLDYLHHRGYKVPKDRVSKDETTGEEALEKIALELKKAGFPEDPVLAQVIKCRKLSKAIGYLYDSFLGRDGRMHTQFTFLPDTGRLSSKNPNLQNIPAGKSGVPVEVMLADAIRSTMIPSKGMVFIELDWKAIEALLVGFFAEDPDYIRISLLDPHSYLASFLVGKPADLAWDDEKLLAYLKGIKKDYYKEREFLAKRANHSDGYGIGVDHLAAVLETDRKTAKWVQEMRARAFPKVHQWKEDTRFKAHYTGELMNPFGYARGFFEVFRKNPNGPGWVHGREANEALSFLPQSTAAGMMRAALLEIAASSMHGSVFWLLLSIHDSVLIECWEGAERAVIGAVKKIMERKWLELGGLKVETDAKVGYNWAKMKEFK